jgi:hypothetical protein
MSAEFGFRDEPQAGGFQVAHEEGNVEQALMVRDDHVLLRKFRYVGVITGKLESEVCGKKGEESSWFCVYNAFVVGQADFFVHDVGYAVKDCHYGDTLGDTGRYKEYSHRVLLMDTKNVLF